MEIQQSTSQEAWIAAKKKGFDPKTTPHEDIDLVNMVIKVWLEQKHRIFINISHKPFSQKFGFSITGAYDKGDSGVLAPYNFKTYDSSEECLEVGILEALTFIES